jgi:ClpP class serine protease
MIRSDLTYALSTGKPLLIDPIKAKSFLANANAILSNPDLAYLLSQHVSGKAYEPKRDVGPRAKRFAGEDDELDTMAAGAGISVPTRPYIKDGIGIIPVRGVIGKCLSPLEAMLGCADIDAIARALEDWKENDNVFEILMAIDSGGGSTTGLEELAKKIRIYDKPTIGFSDSDMGSAAFWIGSQCKRLVVTPSSSVGACGVYITMNDDRKKYEKEGREVVVIKSGKYKAAGVEGTSLTPDQINALQDEVDELHSRFIRDVVAVRQFARIEDLQGQSFYGDKAVTRGLCTGLMDSFEDLIEDIKKTRRVAQKTTLPQMYSEPTIPTSYEGILPYGG